MFPEIGQSPVSELTTSDCRDAVRKIEPRGAPEIARRVLTTCGQIMRYAIARSPSTATWAVRTRGGRCN